VEGIHWVVRYLPDCAHDLIQLDRAKPRPCYAQREPPLATVLTSPFRYFFSGPCHCRRCRPMATSTSNARRADAQRAAFKSGPVGVFG
jgi:hypothetical protein